MGQFESTNKGKQPNGKEIARYIMGSTSRERCAKVEVSSADEGKRRGKSMSQPKELDVKLTYVDGTKPEGTASTAGSSAQPVIFTVALPAVYPTEAPAAHPAVASSAGRR